MLEKDMKFNSISKKYFKTKSQDHSLPTLFTNSYNILASVWAVPMYE